MPFLSFHTHKHMSLIREKSKRKEHDADKSPCRGISPANSKEKASASVFMQGSMTLETALVLPLFFLAVLALVFRLEILAVQTNLKEGLRSAGKELAKEMSVVPFVMPSTAEAHIVDAVGAERLDNSMIEGGSAGIDCRKTWMNPADGKIHLSAAYKIEIPLAVFHIPAWELEEKVLVKAWTGYEKDTFGNNLIDQTVYVTETGVVYHLDPHCHYLELSIHTVPFDTVTDLRNGDGSRYVP